jgi:hypothetical protein
MSCSWPIDTSCLPDVEEGDGVAAAQLEAAKDLAVSVLWALSGRQFGVCPTIVRPCPTAEGGYDYGLGGWFFPTWDGTNWRNISCGCGPKCSYQSPRVVHLAANVALPVREVLEVTIGGVVQDPATYRLEGDLLYRIGGRWPAQDLTKPLDEAGTWSVTYTRGTPPPPGTAKLVALLAKEFFAACTGGKCRLPRRVQTVSRQGVTYQMVNPSDIYAEGRTGLDEIDLWLSSVNPNKLQEPISVR